MSARVAPQLPGAPWRSLPSPTWARLETTAPEMAATTRRYLSQLGESLKPRSIDAAEAVERSHVEDYLAWLRARPGQQPNSTVLAGTIAHRVGLVAKFFERVIAWGYEDAPPQSPISRRDAPPAPRPPAHAKRLSGVPGPTTPATRRPAAGLKGAAPEVSWDEVAARAPEIAATMRRYLEQLGVSARPTTVRAAEGILRLFAGHVSDADPTCRSVAAIERRHIESRPRRVLPWPSGPARYHRVVASRSTISRMPWLTASNRWLPDASPFDVRGKQPCSWRGRSRRGPRRNWPYGIRGPRSRAAAGSDGSGW